MIIGPSKKTMEILKSYDIEDEKIKNHPQDVP